ncbi:MAG: hypothetical protein ACI815_002498, partial [Psychroserpens sp.]
QIPPQIADTFKSFDFEGIFDSILFPKPIHKNTTLHLTFLFFSNLNPKTSISSFILVFGTQITEGVIF